jgi:hypothetical protein
MTALTGRNAPDFLGAGLVAVLILALPAVAADPSARPVGEPGAGELRPEKPPKADREGGSVTVTGVVQETTDPKGRRVFTIAADGTTWTLSAGPKWFWRDGDALRALVGRSVELGGKVRSGGAELHVDRIDGVALRGEARPPWAGGPTHVGDFHPGWKDGTEEQDHGRGRATAPGQLKRDVAAGEDTLRQ